MPRFLGGCLAGGLAMALFSAPLMVQAQNQGNTVRAPFQVLGASGNPILRIEENSGGAILTLLAPGNTAILQSTTDGSMLNLTSPGAHNVNLVTTSSEVSLSGRIGETITSMLINAAEQSLLMAVQGTKVVDIGTKVTTNAAVRIASPSGKLVAQMGSHSGNGGAGAVFVNDSAGKMTGFLVSLANSAAAVGIALNGSEVAKLEPNSSNNGGKLTLADVNGNASVLAGLNSNGDGTVCVYKSQGQQCF